MILRIKDLTGFTVVREVKYPLNKNSKPKKELTWRYILAEKKNKFYAICWHNKDTINNEERFTVQMLNGININSYKKMDSLEFINNLALIHINQIFKMEKKE